MTNTKFIPFQIIFNFFRRVFFLRNEKIIKAPFIKRSWTVVSHNLPSYAKELNLEGCGKQPSKVGTFIFLSFLRGLKRRLLHFLIFPICWFSSFSLTAQTITFDQFLGVNTLRQDPIERLQAVGFAREYHEWVLDMGYPGLNGVFENASLPFPNNQYKWNPSYQTQTHIQFDEFYEAIVEAGCILSPTLFQAVPQLVFPDLTPNHPEARDILEQQPVELGADSTLPASYLAHADYMYQFAARYGSTVFSPTRRTALIDTKLHPNETPVTGLELALYMESWNEPDKWWIPDYPATYFEPKVYAAMLSADYDGHGSTISLVEDPDNPGEMICNAGIINADPKMKVVMGGLSDLDLDYLQEMVAWCDTARVGTNFIETYPFDVINFHYYSNDGEGIQFGNEALSPEATDLRGKLTPLVAYRDATFPDKEIWISEFGYDTDEFSEQRVPFEGIGDSDRQEIQAQWLTRSFLEIAAAGVDRAMVYTLKDVCSADTCGLYASSGLVMNEDYDLQPKKSWYYIYSMKNILKGMVFDSDLSPCASTDCMDDCPRVYKFINPDNSNEWTYAIWSPTSCDKTPYNFMLDLEGAITAEVVELTAPSIYGKATQVNGSPIEVAISERPIFVKAGSIISPDMIEAANNLEVIHQTCSTIRLAWQTDLQADSCQIWRMGGHIDTTQAFDIFQARLVADNISVERGDYLATNLEPDSTYTFVVIMRNKKGELSPPRYVYTTTLTEGCAIPIDLNWIFHSNHPNSTELFDEQLTLNPTCGDTSRPVNIWGIDLENPPISISLDLQEYYFLDAIFLYDDFAFGDFKIEYTEISPNGPWLPLVDYQTIGFKQWITLDNFLPSDTPVRFLRFTSDSTNTAILGELFLCGRAANVDESSFPPGAVKNLVFRDSSCNSVTLQWEAPFDDDISHYEISYEGMMKTVQADGTFLTTTVFGLMPETACIFSIVTVDLDGNASPAIELSHGTLPLSECQNDCDAPCPCFICLKESYVYNLTAVNGINPENLVDEQDNVNPICGTGGLPQTEWGENYDNSNDVPPAIAVIDLQMCHRLNGIYLFDGEGTDILTIEYQDTMGNWIHLLDYTTTKTNAWHNIENLELITRFVRLTKQGNQAKINEIVLCGFPFACEVCSNDENAPDADMDGVADACDICADSDDGVDIDDDGIPDGCDIPCPGLPGEPCDDGDSCTQNDVYDSDCNCLGIVKDSDGDGICDGEDLCPAFDDMLDENNNGIPDGCDFDCNTFVVNTLVTDISCFGENDGKIDLLLPTCNDQSNSEGQNIALGKPTLQSSQLVDAHSNLAVDGNNNGSWFADFTISSTEWESEAWWEMDLEQTFQLDSIKIWRRTDCCADFLSNFYLLISEQPFATDDLSDLVDDANVSSYFFTFLHQPDTIVFPAQLGRYIRIQLSGTASLQLAEMEVFGVRGNECVYDFEWQHNGMPTSFGNIEDVESLAAGDYQVVVNNFNDCSATLDITIEEPEELICSIEVLNMVETPMGNEGSLSVTASGGMGDLVYQWNNGATEGTLNNLSAGNYIVSVTDENNCLCVANISLPDPGGDSDPPEGYCNAIGNQPWTQWIERVVFENIDKTSWKEQYADFTNLTTEVMRGNSYDITLTPGYSFTNFEEYWTVYIDYNRDGDFEDTGELALAEQVVGELTTSITIPNDADLGATRMRVMMQNGAFALPCETFELGEVEDYLLHLRANSNPLGINQNENENSDKETISKDNEFWLFPNPTNGAIWIYSKNWEKKDLRVSIFNELGQCIHKLEDVVVKKTPLKLDLTHLEGGIYWIEVEATNKKKWIKKVVRFY